MKVNYRGLIERHLQDTILAGVRKAHKHQEDPTFEAIADRVEEYIWLELDSYIKWDEFYE